MELALVQLLNAVRYAKGGTMDELESLPRLNRKVAVRRSLAEQGTDDRVIGRTPVECLDMVWPLTLCSWTLSDPTIATARLQRHVVRVTRLEH